MRKLVVLSFITLDGVMQAPGGPEEDPTGGFKYGGWTFPYFDDPLGKVIDKQMSHPFDLLLGRKTYEIFAAYWPYIQDDPIADKFNRVKKYVVSTTLKKLSWANSVLITDNITQEIRTLKEQDGPELQVYGSGVNGDVKARINGAGFDPLIAAGASKIGLDLRASMRAWL